MQQPDPGDREAEEAARELVSLVYEAALRETGDPDRALDLAAEAQRKLREEWEEARRADDNKEER